MSAMPTVLTINQIVGFNLRRARESKGWTQSEAAVNLMKFLGLDRPWTKQTFSAAERSYESIQRQREFTANELIAFCRGFGLPLSYFLTPPDGVLNVATGAPMWSFMMASDEGRESFSWWGYNPKNARPNGKVISGPIGPDWGHDNVPAGELLNLIGGADASAVASRLRALADELETKS